MEKHKQRLHDLNQFLNTPRAIIITLLVLFAYFVYTNHSYQVQNRKLLESTNANTRTTAKVVQGQTDILNAIKQLATDTKIDNNEKTNIIICMLQVPVSQRTTDLQAQCRSQVENQAKTQSTTSSPAPATTNKSSGAGGVSAAKAAPNTSQPTPVTKPSPSPPSSQPSLFDRTVYDPVTNLLKRVLGVQ